MSNKANPTTNINLSDLLESLANHLKKKNLLLVTAESCTGGLISASCTELAGSSQWFDRGFVTYSNQAKVDMLNVPMDLINKHGAVSWQVVEAMANGAFQKVAKTNLITVSVSGIAGPDGGTKDKPVGTVFVGICNQGKTYSQKLSLSGDRAAIRQAVVTHVLQELLLL